MEPSFLLPAADTLLQSSTAYQHPVICGLSLLVLYSVPRSFSLVFPSHQKPTFEFVLLCFNLICAQLYKLFSFKHCCVKIKVIVIIILLLLLLLLLLTINVDNCSFLVIVVLAYLSFGIDVFISKDNTTNSEFVWLNEEARFTCSPNLRTIPCCPDVDFKRRFSLHCHCLC